VSSWQIIDYTARRLVDGNYESSRRLTHAGSALR